MSFYEEAFCGSALASRLLVRLIKTPEHSHDRKVSYRHLWTSHDFLLFGSHLKLQLSSSFI
jgi:hypothetical protein